MARRVFALLCTLLLLSGCAGGLGFGGQQDNGNPYYRPELAKYYKGYEGVEMRLNDLPSKLFFYGNAGSGTVQSAANDFPFSLEVHNKGASYTRGAVFISGYDPNLIEIDGIDIGRSFPGGCSMRIGDYSLNTFGFLFQCDDEFSLRGNEANWIESITVRGSNWFNEDNWLSNLAMTYDEFENGNWRVDFSYDGLDFEARQHGLLLLAITAGLNFDQFNGRDFLLAADAYEYPGGEMDFLDFQGHIVDWPQGADAIEQRFLATSCFLYTTFAAPMVCIDPQPYVENRKVCRPGSWSGASGGQGSPVAITRLEQENTPRSAVFHITVANKGGGTVFDAGALEKCSPYYPGGAKANDLNTVWIGEVRIGDTLLDCSPKHYIRLDQRGEASFTCNYPIEFDNANTAYLTPLVVELWYGYSKTLEQRVLVNRIT
jgi:hypothetical protein